MILLAFAVQCISFLQPQPPTNRSAGSSLDDLRSTGNGSASGEY